MIFGSPFLWLACISAVIAQTPSNCGAKGYDKNNPKAYVLNTSISTLPACKSLCAASTTPKCVSFAVATSPPECLLYNVTFSPTVNFTPSNTSIYTFYDATCTNA
ncbi:hypothetical protein N431DRAFT_431641 [Stipitochalara longipes BDJ]|nr:hypothetical protein N431DRAFT_431641 [Stipitochalara longipes BDJ]